MEIHSFEISPQISHAHTAFKFVLLHAERLHGEQALLRKSRSAPETSALKDPAQILEHYNLKGVREDSHLGLLNWLAGRYPLELRTHIPSPEEMLEAQCQGRRFVTLLAAPELQFQPIGRHAGAYEFLLHDLEHAHKFFGGEFNGQVKFFKMIKMARERGLFEQFKNDEKFCAAFDYLIADMNSHPVHMLKYLKAIVLEAFQRLNPADADGRLRGWCGAVFDLWRMPPQTLTSAMRINQPGEETGSDRVIISEFFTGIST
jgi:hypothetical protein